MDTSIILEGQQLLYSNQFDQLTYNADNIVELTSELDQCLKKFSYSFSSKDSDLIISKNVKLRLDKNLTPFIYWLVIDALYFVQNTSYQNDRINYLRKKRNSNRSSSFQYGEQFDDHKFITKMRYLAYKNKPLQDLQQVKQNTTIDELIELFQKQQQNISKKNDEIMLELGEKSIQSKELFQRRFKQLNVEYVPGSRLIAYYKFSKQMIRQWMEQVQKRKSKSKCRICQRSSDQLLKCQKCDLKVHPICYPKLGKNYFGSNFVCENCEKELDENTSCIYCPIKGGQFLQVQNLSQTRSQYRITKQDGLKIKFHRKIVVQQKSYIHLTCALWHPQLQYNKKVGQIQHIHRVDRKKTQNWCYQCGTNAGVTIPCANENCRRFYHPECALRIQLSTCIINAQNKMLLQLYCDRHRRSYIYETLKQNILSDLKQIKKFFQGIDHQIKRMNSNNYTSDRKIFITSKNDQPQRQQDCMYCQQLHDNINDKIINCMKCYNWYHKSCANRCLYCQPIVIEPIKKIH